MVILIEKLYLLTIKMEKYLFDTNICVFHFRGKFGVSKKINILKKPQCFISEIVLAELTFGALNSNNPTKQMNLLNEFLRFVNVIPISEVIMDYAKIRLQLKQIGKPVDNFDLLIAATAKHFDLTVVTDNVKHFENIQGLNIENWVDRNII